MSCPALPYRDPIASPALLLWVVVVMATCFHSAETEVASSVSAMTSLIAQEENLIEHLGKVLDLARIKGENATWIARIKRYMDCIKYQHRSIASAAGNLAHPIIGFRLVRRLAKEWNDITGILGPTQSQEDNAPALYDNLNGMRDVISKWRRWPKAQDLKDTAMGLIRIGSTYDLYPGTHYHPDQAAASQHDHRYEEDDFDISTFSLSSSDGRNIFRGFENDVKGRFYNSNDSTTPAQCVGDDSCNAIHNNKKSNRYNDNDNSNNNKIQSSKNNNNNMSKSNTSNNGDNIHTSGDKFDKIHPAKDEQSCYYSYTTLDFKDFLYITNVAINQKLKQEAERWYHLVESEFHHGTGRHANERDRVDKMKQRIKAINKPGKNSDTIINNYVKLCRETSEVSTHQPLPPPPNLRCSWRHTHPYLRYKVELLHISPDIYQFHDVISPREINHIKDKAKEKLSPSALDIDESVRDNARYWRVSQTAWLRDETSVLQRLSERVGHLTGLDTGIVTDTKGHLENVYSEPLQVVNYGLGGLYGPHLDTLHSTNHQTGASRQPTGDRLATWMFYLGDVHMGGATVFPRIDVSVKPIKGSAILWYNLLRNGQVDKRTVHAGCPVVIGDKWVANKWVRDTAQWKTRPCLLDPSL